MLVRFQDPNCSLKAICLEHVEDIEGFPCPRNRWHWVLGFHCWNWACKCLASHLLIALGSQMRVVEAHQSYCDGQGQVQ